MKTVINIPNPQGLHTLQAVSLFQKLIQHIPHPELVKGLENEFGEVGLAQDGENLVKPELYRDEDVQLADWGDYE